MAYLAISISCSVAVALLFKYAEVKQLPRFTMLAVNYVVGLVVSLLAIDNLNFNQEKISAILLGILIGILFVLGYLLLLITIRKLGVALPVALMRLSAVLPTLGSIIIFLEIPNIFQIFGIIIAFLALPLAQTKKKIGVNKLKHLSIEYIWGIVLFITFGVTEFLLKVQTEIFSKMSITKFLLIVYAIAFLISCGMAIYQKSRLDKTIILVGFFLGIFNFFSTLFFLKALQSLPGILVYPSNGIGIIFLTTVSGVIFWQEKLSGRSYLFLVLSMIALVFINI
jgi:drug/metabolite transporter (DMT)-like permease